ncbi:MAG: trigger factor [Chloroflexi bacterium]|nr:trigger factor [Chloroflexota bacterium]
MTLKIQTEQDEQRQLLITIEVPEKRVQKQMRLVARKLGRDVNMPGFRRGKAPYPVIVNRVGKETLRKEAVEEIVQPIFEEALEELDPDLFAQAQFDDMELEPLVLKFTLPLTPEVDLGDYRSLRKEIEPVSITDEAVEEALEAVRVKNQVLEEVNRPVEEGDIITISGIGKLLLPEEDGAEEDVEIMEAPEVEELPANDEDDEYEESEDEVDEMDPILFDTERLDLVMDADKLFPGTEFVANLVGTAVGETKSFAITFPDDFEDEDLAGKEATFSMTVIEVQSHDLPDLTDELAVEEGFETLAEMREDTFNNLQEAAENQAKSELIEGMIDDMLPTATLVYPPAAVEMKIDSRLNSFKDQITRSGWEWEDYLTLQTITEDEMRQDFQEDAIEAVERQFVLRQFILDEKLEITDEDVEAKIAELTTSFEDNEVMRNNMHDFYKQGAGFDMLSSEILIDKVAERTEAILSGNAPDLAELEAEEEAEEETAAEDVTEEESAGDEVVDTVDEDEVEEMAEPETAADNEDEEEETAAK